MTHVMHRQLNRTFPAAVGGTGVWLVDAEGRRYLDASGGAAVSCLGHGHRDVLDAMRAQMDAIAYAHTRFFTTPVAETLADTLVAGAPRGIGHVYFVSGGSEAVEAARLAHERRVIVVALTDSPLSPLAPHATHLLLFRAASLSFFHSMLAPLALVELLLAQQAARGGRAVLARLARIDRQMTARGAYWRASPTRRSR